MGCCRSPAPPSPPPPRAASPPRGCAFSSRAPNPLIASRHPHPQRAPGPCHGGGTPPTPLPLAPSPLYLADQPAGSGRRWVQRAGVAAGSRRVRRCTGAASAATAAPRPSRAPPPSPSAARPAPSWRLRGKGGGEARRAPSAMRRPGAHSARAAESNPDPAAAGSSGGERAGARRPPPRQSPPPSAASAPPKPCPSPPLSPRVPSARTPPGRAAPCAAHRCLRAAPRAPSPAGGSVDPAAHACGQAAAAAYQLLRSLRQPLRRGLRATTSVLAVGRGATPLPAP